MVIMSEGRALLLGHSPEEEAHHVEEHLLVVFHFVVSVVPVFLSPFLRTFEQPHRNTDIP